MTYETYLEEALGENRVLRTLLRDASAFLAESSDTRTQRYHSDIEVVLGGPWAKRKRHQHALPYVMSDSHARERDKALGWAEGYDAARFDLAREIRRELREEVHERAKHKRMVTAAMRQQVHDRDGRACLRCGAHGEGVLLHADHIVPFSLGGACHVDNLQTLCAGCNLTKPLEYQDYRSHTSLGI